MDLKIVEYDNKYANSLAEMWNKSSDNWGGSDNLTTEEDIIMENENSANLHIYLALDGDTVIGYCSLSEYQEDEGALYIPLLNVRPDYHGKKVGKALVLKTVERTIELGWPRLDLYTWPGNTKAVPLYKKAGFFWEKRDNTTHLMNFIPSVLNIEAIKDYFKDIDWYNDSKLEIAIEPDGNEEDNFCFYEYKWEKDNTKLRIGFERRGRGLRLIETDDYLIKAYLDQYELVFGKNYKIFYQIKNKTGKSLEIELQGINDKNIKFDFNKKITVENEKLISSEFYVDTIQKQQKPEKTHPGVITNLKINGKKAQFKLGIKPEYPANIHMVTLDEENYLNVEQECHFIIENCYKEPAEFTYYLPENDKISFSKDKIHVNLEAEEITTVSLKYILQDFFVLSAETDVKVNLKKSTTSFKKKLRQLFRGNQGIFGGQTDHDWVICNGRYSVFLNKNNHSIKINNFKDGCQGTSISFPRIGKPFSIEFSKNEPEEVCWEKEDENIKLIAHYKSKDFPEIEIDSVTVLENSGLVKHYYQLCNTSQSKTSREIFFADCFHHYLKDGLIPYDGNILKIKDNNHSHLNFFDMDLINENWLFSESKNCSRGIIWPEDKKLTSSDWTYSIKYNFGHLDKKTKVKTSPIIIAVGLFSDWKKFRKFALKNQDPEKAKLINEYCIEINKGNPILKAGKASPVVYRNLAKSNLSGTLNITSEKDNFLSKSTVVNRKDNNILAKTDINIKKPGIIDTVDLEFNLKTQKYNTKKIIFIQGNKAIDKSVTQEKNKEILKFDNGSISLKISPDFSYSLFSLTYKGQEWLDSSFPSPGPKAWWNPWSGGLFVRPVNIDDNHLLSENRNAEFATLEDNFGNKWSGISMNVNIEKSERHKGLSYNHYFLTLPDLPLLLSVIKINQNTGSYYYNENFKTTMFVKSGENINNSWVVNRNKDQKLIKYKAGETGQSINSKKPVLFGSKDRNESLLVYKPGPDQHWCHADNKTINLTTTDKFTAGNGQTKTTDPVFMFFTDCYCDKSLIESLKNISFS